MAIVLLVSLIALAMGAVFRKEVLAAPEGSPKMQEIAQAVEEGAQAYLRRQFRTLFVFGVLAFLLLFVLPGDASIRIGRSVFFVVGALFSAFIGYMGMSLAVKANQRMAAAAQNVGRDPAMKVAFRTGGAVGMATVGLGLLGASVVVLIYKDDAPSVLEGFGFGAALLAMFMRVGGGIFTKAADVGADLVGKVEQNIPEDDPRNPATIADNVGDNVGDCAGMAADLFESYAVTLVAALILGKIAFGSEGLVFPLIVPTIGAVTAILGVYLTRPREGEGGLTTINRAFYVSAIVSAVLVAIAAFLYLPTTFDKLQTHGAVVIAQQDGNPRQIAILSVLIGIILAAVILTLTGYFTGTENRPVKDVAKTSLTGAATVILAGISVGYESAVYTAIVISGALYGCFQLGGNNVTLALFSVALAGTGLLTTVGVIVAMDTFGPVSDNAQGIAEMSGEVDARGAAILTELDAVGNTTKADDQGHRDRHRGAGRHRPLRLPPGSRHHCRRRGLRKSHQPGLRGAAAARSGRPLRNDQHRRPGQPGRPAARRSGRLPVLRAGDQRRRPGRGSRGLRGASPVPGDSRDHGGHRPSRVRQGRRHLHPRLAP